MAHTTEDNRHSMEGTEDSAGSRAARVNMKMRMIKVTMEKSEGKK